MPGPLIGKLAIVTGAGSGIGRAICRVLFRDGASVIAADKNLSGAQETISSLGSDCTAQEVDVTSSDSISKAVTRALEKYKRPPSILVNSAGIIRDAYFLKMTEVQFDEVVDTNLKGTFLVTQHFVNAMVQYKVNGSVINLSSIVANINNIGQANYAASKCGVQSLTRVACKEFGKYNVRVNAVLPGFIDTPMVASIPDAAKEHALSNCVLRRLGRPDEVAEVVAFLASEKSSFVNGSLLEVTGGSLLN